MRFKSRYQLSAAGVHRPLLNFVHAGRDESAFSIILQGNNKMDCGDEFFYVCDDMYKKARARYEAEGNKGMITVALTGNNLALARSCYAELNPRGAQSAQDWQAGLPVRVVRCPHKKQESTVSPNDGYRYDGIYKVVSYTVDVSEGFPVYSFFLRRDDPEPAPWHENGIEYNVIVSILNSQ
ncbi:unnamed protein product [Diabrotica balteata]|uniref:YDG domain-containing protein n=1 Tax=Diabrotica balteata TaxID=107213 RepID=A0A9N9X893_DIABA|nr:unnamed protein product [Diabrotica balteata]